MDRQSVTGYWRFGALPRFMRALLMVAPIFFYLTITAWNQVHFGGFLFGYFYIVILLVMLSRTRWAFKMKRSTPLAWAMRLSVGLFWLKAAFFIFLAYMIHWPDKALLTWLTYVDVMAVWIGFQLIAMSHCAVMQLDIPACASSATELLSVITYKGGYASAEGILTHIMLLGTASFLTLMVMMLMVSALAMCLWPVMALWHKIWVRPQGS